MDFCCLICMHVHLEYRFACYRVGDLLWTCLMILVSLVVDLIWFVDLWWYLWTICVICGLLIFDLKILQYYFVSGLFCFKLWAWAGSSYKIALWLAACQDSFIAAPKSNCNWPTDPFDVYRSTGHSIWMCFWPVVHQWIIWVGRGGNGPWPWWPLHSPTKPLNFLVQNCIRLEPGLFRPRPLDFLVQNIGPFTTPMGRLIT